MKERGLIMTGPSIPALLNTKPGVWPAEPIDPTKPFKWQTRRKILRPERFSLIRDCIDLCPHGMTGDRVYIKESVGYLKGAGVRVVYKADGEPRQLYYPDEPIRGMKWKSPLLMKRSEARLVFDLVEVRVQQLGEISEYDGRAEGVEPHVYEDARPGTLASYRVGFIRRWHEIHGDTPLATWVWVLTLARVA